MIHEKCLILNEIEKTEIKTLNDFYYMMLLTRDVRRAATELLIRGRSVSEIQVNSLKAALGSLLEIKNINGIYSLSAGNRNVLTELSYEISELKKDIYYLENSEEEFINYLADSHPNFREQVEKCFEELSGKKFTLFVTDRDGTVNNHCERYNSSIQSIYNALFLTRFARKCAGNSVVITSAALENTGIVDVSVAPADIFIYAGSRGREFYDRRGNRHYLPVNSRQHEKMKELNEILECFVSRPENKIFSLIGSGFQPKLGQTTLARQDIRGSVSEESSIAFLRCVVEIVRKADPGGAFFRIEDTGTDIEILLVGEKETNGPAGFNKGAGLRFIDKELGLKMEEGPVLVCGDTYSDILMAGEAAQKADEMYAVFVAKDENLQKTARSLVPNAIFVDEPDVLVASLNSLAVRGAA